MKSPSTLLCLFALVGSVARAEDQKPAGPIVGQAVKGDTSKPLRELAAEAAQAQAEAEKQLDAPTKAIRKTLQDKYGASGERGEVKALADADLAKALPKIAFYSLRFRTYPVAFEVPAGLSSGNVCVVHGDDVTILSNAKSLEQFFAKNLAAAVNDDDKVSAAKAWLRLSQELHSDGFYKFKPLDEKSVKVEKDSVTGTCFVEPVGGNQGQIELTMKFDAGGKLAKAEEQANFKAGVRPICQATKLLDADPLVRRIAQRDILVMGRIALDYLLEQRAQASPELRAAIDEVWDQILAEER